MKVNKLQNRVIENFFRTMATLDFGEREELLLKLMEDNKWSLRQASTQLQIPLTTLHGWVTRRDKKRRKITDKGISEELRKSCDINRDLRDVYDILKKLKEIDNGIGMEILEKIEKEIKRLKE